MAAMKTLIVCAALLMCVASCSALRKATSVKLDLPAMPTLVEAGAKTHVGDGDGAGAENDLPAPPSPDAHRSPPLGNPTNLGTETEAEQQLDTALQAVKDDIVAKSRQIQDEQAWVTEVEKITKEYNNKILKVKEQILKLQRQVKDLYKKKKQIENLRLQKQLSLKLKDAQSDLEMLQNAVTHVNNKAVQFTKTQKSVEKTIHGLETELTKLRGVSRVSIDSPSDSQVFEAAQEELGAPPPVVADAAADAGAEAAAAPAEAAAE